MLEHLIIINNGNQLFKCSTSIIPHRIKLNLIPGKGVHWVLFHAIHMKDLGARFNVVPSADVWVNSNSCSINSH